MWSVRLQLQDATCVLYAQIHLVVYQTHNAYWNVIPLWNANGSILASGACQRWAPSRTLKHKGNLKVNFYKRVVSDWRWNKMILCLICAARVPPNQLSFISQPRTVLEGHKTHHMGKIWKFFALESVSQWNKSKGSSCWTRLIPIRLKYQHSVHSVTHTSTNLGNSVFKYKVNSSSFNGFVLITMLQLHTRAGLGDTTARLFR